MKLQRLVVVLSEAKDLAQGVVSCGNARCFTPLSMTEQASPYEASRCTQ